jgi:hypothetical protein
VSDDSLHPEHLADLRKSGLSDETIRQAGVYSVRPADISKISAVKGITSLLAIPYSAAFTRYKVWPVGLHTTNGKLRYIQPSQSGAHLYVPPILPRAILQDPTQRLRRSGEIE